MSPKTYFAIDPTSDKYKRSSKGVQHRVELDYKNYYDTLYQSTEKMVQNAVIRMYNNEMTSMITRKAGLRNILVKCYVHDDLVTTSPFQKFQ